MYIYIYIHTILYDISITSYPYVLPIDVHVLCRMTQPIQGSTTGLRSTLESTGAWLVAGDSNLKMFEIYVFLGFPLFFFSPYFSFWLFFFASIAIPLKLSNLI